MGLLDNLFKPKPDSGGEKSVENFENGGLGGRTASSQKVSPFLAPKNYVPRSSAQIVPPARNQLQGEAKVAPFPGAPRQPMEIVVTLGDVLSRIPTHFLRKSSPDLRRELRFPAEGLAADLARGRATVLLADIVAQCPEVFLADANGFDAVQIRLPLQKLVEQVGLSGTTSDVKLHPMPSEDPTDFQRPAETNAARNPDPTTEEQIHLSLAAIMKRCPPEIIVGPVPPIGESIRVTFPFAPIARQLSTGQVEVSSLRFIAALPLDLMTSFEARAGVKVPLPLEEIFQNLPNQAPPPPMRPQTFSPPEQTVAATVPAELPDYDREKARLVESILLEPMFEPVGDAQQDLVAKNNVIDATFATEPANPSAGPCVSTFQSPSEVEPERKVEASAPEVRETETENKLASQSRVDDALNTDAADEMAARLEALAAEDAKIDAELQEKTPQVDEPAADYPSAASQTEPSVFPLFAPTLRPEVILQPTTAPEGLRPESASTLMTESSLVVPIAEPEPPIPPEPIQPPYQPFVPVVELAVTATLPIPSVVEELPAADSAPPESESPTTATMPPDPPLRITVAQFRPFIVQAPPIILAPEKEVEKTSTENCKLAEVEQVIAAANASESCTSPATIGMAEEPSEMLNPAEPQPTSWLPPSRPDPGPEPRFLFLPGGHVREYFPDDEPLDLPRVSEMLAALPGIRGCVLVARAAESQSGDLPPGIDPGAIRDLTRRMRGAFSDHAELFRSGEVQQMSLQSEKYSLTLFIRGEACACAVHRARIFLPSVRERYLAVAEELGAES